MAANEPILVLTLIAAIWAAFNAIVTVYKVLNETRDQILLGTVDRMPLTIQHRRLMLYNDWVPLQFSVAVVSAMFGIAIIMIPQAAADSADSRWFSSVCYVASALPILNGFAFLACGFKDFRFLRSQLDVAAKQVRVAESAGDPC